MAHCDTIDCSQATQANVDAEAGGGLSTSIAIGSDGFPVISNVSLTRDGVRLVRCHDLVCASSSGFDLPESSSLGGTAVAVDAEGRPVASYHGVDGLWLAACEDETCNAIRTYQVDDHAEAGIISTVAVHDAGLPMIVYFTGENIELRSAVPASLSSP